MQIYITHMYIGQRCADLHNTYVYRSKMYVSEKGKKEQRNKRMNIVNDRDWITILLGIGQVNKPFSSLVQEYGPRGLARYINSSQIAQISLNRIELFCVNAAKFKNLSFRFVQVLNFH